MIALTNRMIVNDSKTIEFFQNKTMRCANKFNSIMITTIIFVEKESKNLFVYVLRALSFVRKD